MNEKPSVADAADLYEPVGQDGVLRKYRVSLNVSCDLCVASWRDAHDAEQIAMSIMVCLLDEAETERIRITVTSVVRLDDPLAVEEACR